MQAAYALRANQSAIAALSLGRLGAPCSRFFPTLFVRQLFGCSVTSAAQYNCPCASCWNKAERLFKSAGLIKCPLDYTLAAIHGQCAESLANLHSPMDCHWLRCLKLRTHYFGIDSTDRLHGSTCKWTEMSCQISLLLKTEFSKLIILVINYCNQCRICCSLTEIYVFISSVTWKI